jgi:hypothetical protein
MAGILAPISSTPKRSSVPSSLAATARLSAVWPPSVGALALDDLGDELRRERLHVGPGRHLGVGHDGGRVAVDEDDLEPLLAQRPAPLGPRVVELTGLADDDRPRADDEDLLQIGALGHQSSINP